MAYIVVCSVTFILSILSLFSGFGLGSVLMPAFALFFPLQLAIAATAVVHLANNIFKVLLVGKDADWVTVVKFGIPAAISAMVGAALLTFLDKIPVLMSYSISSVTYEITVLKLSIGVIIVGFALFEISPFADKLEFDKKYMPLGGIISGFFGGLSGNQGALRSAFLIKSGLSKEAFIGTGTVATVIVDICRILVYGLTIYTTKLNTLSNEIWNLVIAATVVSFIGTFTASRLVKKIKFRTIQLIVCVMLVAVGLAIASGIF